MTDKEKIEELKQTVQEKDEIINRYVIMCNNYDNDITQYINKEMKKKVIKDITSVFYLTLIVIITTIVINLIVI